MNKKFLMNLGLCAIGYLAVWGAEPETTGMSVSDGSLQAESVSVKVFSDDFRKPAPDRWLPAKSFNNLIKFEFGSREDVTGFVVYNNAKIQNQDTAWQLVSKPVKLPTGAVEWNLNIAAASRAPLHIFDDRGDQWRSCLIWYDAAGNVLSRTNIKYAYYSPDKNEKVTVQQNRNKGKIPAKAASVAVSLGLDLPNICNGDFIVYTGVSLRMAIKGVNYPEKACYVSRIMPCTGGTLNWKADVPENCSLKFQVAAAPDSDGGPGKWGKFTGPDGKTDSRYVRSGTKLHIPEGSKWLRYRAEITTDQVNTPVIREVVMGKIQDKNWTVLTDRNPPETVVVSSSPAENLRQPLALRITDDNPVDWKSLKITMDGKDITNSFVKMGNILTFAPEKPFRSGLNTVTVTVRDILGNQRTVKRYFFIGKPVTKNVVSLRDDGMTLIDGKPFFPIFMFSVHPCKHNGSDLDRAMKELAENGFNAAHTYRSGVNDTIQFSKAASRHGIKVLVSGPPDCNTKNTEQYLRAVIACREYDSILAWVVGDDTRYCTTPEQLKERCDAIKAVAPTHLTYQVDGIGSPENPYYRPFVHSTDTFGACNYTVDHSSPKTTARIVPLVIRGMKTVTEDLRVSGNPPKSIWSCLQNFKGWGWNTYPTFAQLRAMSWASIIHGGHGISWYTYAHYKEFGATATKESWDAMKKVAREIHSLAPVLCERKGPQPDMPRILAGPKKDALDYPSVTCLVKKHNGKTYLFAVNSAMENVKAEFRLPGLKRGRVINENREAVLNNSSLIDWFKGTDVHLYELE